MEVLSFFSTKHLQNTYIVHQEGNSQALLVDPMEIEVALFSLLESHSLTVGGIILTHVDDRKANAVRSLERIYGPIEKYGGNETIETIEITNVKELDDFSSCGFSLQPIFIPGHHSDALIYKIQNTLFTGDLISAGLIEKADESYGRALLIHCLEDTLKALPPTTIILPSHGPPTSVKTELETNYDFHHQEKSEVSISSKLFFIDY